MYFEHQSYQRVLTSNQGLIEACKEILYTDDFFSTLERLDKFSPTVLVRSKYLFLNLGNEIQDGAGGGGAGGLAFAPVSGGASLVGGAAAVAGGAILAGHGATVMYSGGSNIGGDSRSIAESIAYGHAWDDHIVEEGQFQGMFNTQDDFANYIDDVMNNATEVKQLQDGRTGFWDEANQAVVIHNPNAKDQGTSFQPKDGKVYFDEQLH